MRWEIAKYLSAGPPIGRTEVAQALSKDLPDDVGKVRSLMHRALGRAQTAEHTETVELAGEAEAEPAPERTVLQTQVERAFSGGTLLGLASPVAPAAPAGDGTRETWAPPQSPSGVARLEELAGEAAARVVSVGGSAPDTSRARSGGVNPPALAEGEHLEPTRRRGWAVPLLVLLFVAAVAAGAGIGLGAREEEPSAPVVGDSAAPIAAEPAPAPAPTPPPVVVPPVPEALPVALEPPAEPPAEAPPDRARPRAASPRRAAAGSPAPAPERERARPVQPETAPPPRAQGGESARLTVRAPNGWARVFLNGAGPFMAPFRDRVVPAGRVSVRFESPRGDLTVVRQVRPGDAVVLSAP
jgi:hypothetical protein